VASAFDEAGAQLSKDFNMVGNSIVAFALDADAVVGHFLDVEVVQFVSNTLSEAGTFFEGVGSDIKGVFEGNDCEIM